MPEVIVTLSLTRKSGILAAAVSSLARQGLEFKSHRFIESEDADGLKVELMADGDVADSVELTESLERIRGVDSVTDIGVDGKSLLKGVQARGDQTGKKSVDQPSDGLPVARPVSEPRQQTEPKAPENDDTEEAANDDASGRNTMRRTVTRRRRRFT